jgi:ketosteroid isomerase-like protein
MGLTACQKPETAAQLATRLQAEATAARPQFEQVAKAWERWSAAGQSDSIAGAFVEDAYELPPNAPPQHGRAAIQAFHTQQASLGQTTVHISVDEVMANGPLATSRGAYDIAIQPGPNAPAGMTAVADTGKWVGVWRKTGDQWQFTTLIWNSNIPLPPPPAPAPTRRR